MGIQVNGKLLLDCEVFPNYFLLGFKDYVTNETESIEVSPWKDEREKLIKWLRTYKGFVISFNGIYYDNMVLAFIKVEWESLYYLDSEDFCSRVKRFSDLVINSEQYYEQLKPYKYVFSKQWIDIDLYLYWSLMLRKSKKISLKGLGIQMRYPVVMELPYDPDLILTQEQIEEIKVYNLSHDLGILALLVRQFTGHGNIPLGPLGTIQLRQKIVKDYRINAWSMDSPKIASETLLTAYCKQTGKNKRETSYLRFDKPIIKFKDLLSDIGFEFQTKVFQDVFNDWLNAVDTFNKQFIVGLEVGQHPLKISVGIGGIHSINNNEIYESKGDIIIVTDDISAMYPTNIENWKAFRFPEVLETYVGFKTKRITETKPGMKKYPKGSSEWNSFHEQDLFYKLILNGVSGLLDMEHSWLYNPTGIMKVRCGGQLILLWLIEQCIINKIHVISCNTDGLEVKLHKNQFDLYLSLVKQAEQKFKVQFEREIYKKIVYSNVNSYIAILENGSLKKKGDFVTNPELGSSVDFLVIPKCLELYFAKGIKPEEILKDPLKYDLHIYDFCASFKVNKDYTVWWNNEKQQRLNRFYVSDKSPYLYKLKNSKSTFDNMLKGWGVQLFNVFEEKKFSDYKVDNKFYLSKINTIISELEPKQQKLF